MNLILTSKCNNNCSFCFARDTLKDNETLSFEDTKKIIDLHGPQEPIKLLGGEPTLCPYFGELLEYLKSLPNPITLISNFIFNNDIAEKIINFKEHPKQLDTLINVSETEGAKLEKVIQNIKHISLNGNFAIGFTLNLQKHFNYYKDKLNKFNDSFKDFSIRVSLPFPNPDIENTFYLYKKYEYIDLLVEFVKWSTLHMKNISLDCGVFPCMIKDEKIEHFLEQHLSGFKYGCVGIPADIINKNEIQYCYPAKNIKININEHNEARTIMNELNFLNREITCSGKLPQECQTCEFLYNKCPGPCLGFIKLE